MDRDCAFFVRDALFPLRRDWGNNSNRKHTQIHPALNALDRLRTELVDKRPSTMSYSNVFPRGVLVVTKSDALGTDADTHDSSNHQIQTSNGAMEYNGQPDVNESNATVEVIPDILTVKCMQCDKFRPSSSEAAAAFVRTKTNPYTKETQHELVVCSDRVLKKDYFYYSRTNHTVGSGRREDLPAKSLKTVEEALSRQITNLTVNSDGNGNQGATQATPAVAYSSLTEASQKPCEEHAARELLAARAAECLLVRTNDEVRMGSALRPSSAFLFSMLPSSIQRNFADRCVQKVATKHTVEAATKLLDEKELSPLQAGEGFDPKECVKRAWANRHD